MSAAQTHLAAESAVRTRLLPAAEVADRLSISTSCLANWRRNGSGPAYVKAGGIVRYAEADVDAFLQSARHSAA